MNRCPILLLSVFLFAITGSDAGATLPADTGVNWNLTPEQIADHCKEQLARASERIHAIDARATRDASPALLEEIETVTADVSDALLAESNLSQLAPAKDVRDAATHCSEDIAKFGVAVDADPVIYSIARRAQGQSTAPAQRRLAELYVESGRRAGAGLAPARRAESTRLFEAQEKLEIAFQRALGEDHSSITISKSEASSLPDSFVRTLQPSDDGYIVSVNESTLGQFLNNEAVAVARQRYFIAYNRRGGEANVTRLTQVVALRDRLAHLLGFKTWAAYRLDARMAKTPEAVLTLLTRIDSGLLPKARTEVAELAELKRASGDPAPFARWDYIYFENQLQKTRYAVDKEVVRTYFPVDKVIPAVFGIYEKLFGVRIEALTPALAWAPGVTEYSVTDAASGAALGWCFLDLYPREGKYNHFAMFGMRRARTLPDGSAELPISAIVGNWAIGEPGKPALLSHQEVITFFHEFGHLMHNSLSHTPYQSTSGTHVRRDFVEAPSQMLENFMWQPAILKQVSGQVTTGEPIPDDLVEKMIAAKHVGDGMFYSTQAFLGTYDMRLHSSGEKIDPTRLWFDLSPQLTPFAAVPGTIPEAGFAHLMGGYDAGYYGYLWSLVYAQDIFSVFAREGIDNAAVGMRYRREILEPGGLVEPGQLIENFLGRPVSYEPFYHYIGISAP